MATETIAVTAGRRVEDERLAVELSSLLAEGLAATADRAAGEFHRLAAPFEDRLIISGTGHLGRLALSGVRAAGIEPLAFCDNNSQLWGKFVDGLVVISPAEAAERYRDSAAFVVAIYNSAAPRRQLRDLRCTRIVPYPAFFWKFCSFMPREDRLELPERILANVREMESGYRLLSDERSRQEFRAQIRWRCLLDYTCLPAYDHPREMYFPRDLFDISSDEVFVDCGAFDGDSLQTFLTVVNGHFNRIYAWEADQENAVKLAQCIGNLPPAVAAKVAILPYAVGREDGTVRFSHEGTVGSRVGMSEASTEVVCRSIDSAFASVRPTLIKMDIEGAEPQALLGAMKTMARHRPVMAVCAYHKCDHLWSLPQLLKDASPDYEIFLRRYAEDCWETVYYAVPPERLSSNAGLGRAISEDAGLPCVSRC